MDEVALEANRNREQKTGFVNISFSSNGSLAIDAIFFLFSVLRVFTNGFPRATFR